MKTLMCVIPGPKDVTAFYRFSGPMGEILSRTDEINLMLAFNTEIYDDLVYLARAAFMQRPFHESHYQVAKIIKRNGRPLWVDFDDDLFDVPPDNPVYETYAEPKIRRHMAEIIAMADIVTVTTEALKEKFSLGAMKGKDIRVVPNAIDFGRFPQQPKTERSPLILWRGSRTHHQDVMSVAKQMLDVYREKPKFVWEFLGDRLWFVTSQMAQINAKRVVPAPALGIMEYHQHIIDVAPKVVIAPLVKNAFNRSKSNIAFLEATYAGALCLAPSFKEWSVPGCITYDGAEDFEAKLLGILNNEFDSQLEVAKNWVAKNRGLRKVNEMREQILKELL